MGLGDQESSREGGQCEQSHILPCRQRMSHHQPRGTKRRGGGERPLWRVRAWASQVRTEERKVRGFFLSDRSKPHVGQALRSNEHRRRQGADAVEKNLEERHKCKRSIGITHARHPGPMCPLHRLTNAAVSEIVAPADLAFSTIDCDDIVALTFPPSNRGVVSARVPIAYVRQSQRFNPPTTTLRVKACALDRLEEGGNAHQCPVWRVFV